MVLLSGCVQVAPNLKLPEPKPCPKPVTPAPVNCPSLTMPPIADKVHISIDGDKVKADAGGEALLRYYVKAQSLLQ